MQFAFLSMIMYIMHIHSYLDPKPNPQHLNGILPYNLPAIGLQKDYWSR